MSLNEREVSLIHAATEVRDGRKYFGNFDHLVGQETKTETFELSTSVNPQLSIIMPVMERKSRFRTAINRLTSSLTKAELVTTLIILDNSLLDDVRQEIKDRAEQLRGTPITRVIYHHNPRMIQSTGRNFAYQEFIDKSQFVGIWDSDIYCSVQTIGEVMKLWNTASHMVGIAPPMGSYTKGNIDAELNLYGDIRDSPLLRRRLHMPGAIGEENGIWSGDVLRTTMMRGAFFIKKSFIDKITACNQDKEPWLKDFVVWQNVPFFLSVREFDGDFGYAMSSEAIVLHDDRKGAFSVSQSIPYTRTETLKSLSMLIIRNKVFSPTGRAINSRFLRYNIPVISRVTNFDEHLSVLTQEALLQISKLLVESEDPKSFSVEWESSAKNYPREVTIVINGVVAKLSEVNVFFRVKRLKSFKPENPMYTI